MLPLRSDSHWQAASISTNVMTHSQEAEFGFWILDFGLKNNLLND
jgi:hypothetical protein